MHEGFGNCVQLLYSRLSERFNFLRLCTVLSLTYISNVIRGWVERRKWLSQIYVVVG